MAPLQAHCHAIRSDHREDGATGESYERSDPPESGPLVLGAVFGQTYDQGSNSQAAKDVGELLAWCVGGEPPESVSGFRFDPEVLRDITTRQSALYRGTMCLILSYGPRDVHSGAKLTGHLIAQSRIDGHHVFPRAYLDRQGVEARLRDCVLNRTLIDRTTNQSLRARARGLPAPDPCNAWGAEAPRAAAVAPPPRRAGLAALAQRF
jgi:hypothetical protein